MSNKGHKVPGDVLSHGLRDVRYLEVKTDLYVVGRLVGNDLANQGESHVSFVLKKFPEFGIQISISVLENDQRAKEARAIAKNTPLNTPQRAELVR